jgi:hypothetical protein
VMIMAAVLVTVSRVVLAGLVGVVFVIGHVRSAATRRTASRNKGGVTGGATMR